MEEEKKKKILLIKLSSLGDVIFNIPLANALKNIGNYEITWLVSEKGIQVVKNNPCVDKAILAPVVKWKKRGLSFESFKEYLGILKQLRAEKFDIAIDAQMMLKSLYWMLFCGAKRRIISKEARELAILGGNEWIDDISYAPDSPIVLNYLKYANHLGIYPEQIRVTLPQRTEEQIQKIDILLQDLDKSKPLVVIAPATTWENKHWGCDNWKSVIDNISQNCNIVFTGGPNDNELIEKISGGRFLNLAGKTDIMELAEVFSRANLVIAPDSGSAHLAWATGKPAVIAIFTCTPKEVLGPYGNPEKYVSMGGEGLPCQPCFKRKCKLRKNKNACTNFPNPKDVVDVANRLIFGR
ncbi:MAG: glycosyltransferase family 9 protein [Candidatus Gastranaerophilales bacterium]|nr:glycosyltransferase family 9 protein [Candidatus Gastranaerophilales bacterium]